MTSDIDPVEQALITDADELRQLVSEGKITQTDALMLMQRWYEEGGA
jgi:hypothetical protein